MKFCKADDSEYGEVVFFVDPATKNVVCSIDGEDNHNLFSYEGIKDGHLAHPIHVSHFDLWFNNQYDPTVIKGMLRLRFASAESFTFKEAEIKEKYNNWVKQSLVGLISKDSTTLGMTGDSIGRNDVKVICNFFLKNALANGDTNLLVNGKELGTIEAIFGQENPKMIVTAQEDDAQVLQLIQNFKSGDPQLQHDAGDALIMKYDKQLRGLLNNAARAHQQSTHPEDPDYQDKLQELYTYFLERLRTFDPAKAKITTFIQSNIALIIKNMFNSNRSKIDKHTQTVGPTSTESGGGDTDDVTYTDPSELKRYKDRSEAPQDSYENNELLNTIMENSNVDPKLLNILKKYYYEGKTYQQIGQEEGVSGSRIEQLVKMTLDRLRSNPEVRQLSPEAYKKVENIKVAMLFKSKDE